MSREIYAELKAIVHDQNGTMHHIKKGYPRGGAWVIKINDIERIFVSSGNGFPELDQLYEPKKKDPSSWRDYTCKLLPSAKTTFLNKFQS